MSWTTKTLLYKFSTFQIYPLSAKEATHAMISTSTFFPSFTSFLVNFLQFLLLYISYQGCTHSNLVRPLKLSPLHSQYTSLFVFFSNKSATITIVITCIINMIFIYLFFTIDCVSHNLDFLGGYARLSI